MTGNKIYHGANTGPGPQLVHVFAEKIGPGKPKTYTLRHRVQHSPDGFQWGYGGSGPADLALSILWDFTGEEPDPATYQEFKRKFIATAGQQLRIEGHEILGWIAGRRTK